MNPRIEKAPSNWLKPREERKLLPDDAPVFCPACGRPLEYSYWDTVDGGARYHAFVCFGDNWLAPFHRRFKTTTPGGTHYQYHFGPSPITGLPIRFDRLTGAPLDEEMQ